MAGAPHKINANALADSDRVSLDVVRTALANGLGTAEFNWGTRGLRSTPYLVNQISGAYASIPDFLDSQHPIKSAEDAADYLKRLSAYAVVLDQETARIAADAERGVIPPDFAVDGAIKQLKKFAALKPAETVLVSSLARRLKETNSIEASAAPELVARAEKYNLPGKYCQHMGARSQRSRQFVRKLPRSREFGDFREGEMMLLRCGYSQPRILRRIRFMRWA